jgi:co-chaperonin GroES (HSP10)
VATKQTFQTCKLAPGLVAIEPTKPKENIGSIALAWGSQSPDSTGVVINAGDFPDVQVGDVVVFERFAGAHHDIEDGDQIVVCKSDAILAIVEN